MSVRRVWRPLATAALLLGAIVAVATSHGTYAAAFEGLGPALTDATPLDAAPLGDSMAAWQAASAEQRAEHLAWLLRAGLERRRAALTSWIDRRAQDRARRATTTLSTIFLVLAGASFLLVLLPFFVRRARAPHRWRLWLHSILAAVTLCATLLLLMAGLSALMAMTSSVSAHVDPEQGLVDAAFLEIERDAKAWLAGGRAAADPLPYGPVVGAAADPPTDGPAGGFLTNLLHNLRYFDASAFEPAVVWTRRAWHLLGTLSLIVPFLVALVFLLTARGTLLALVRWPIEAGRGVDHIARRALRRALGFVLRELLAIFLLVLVLLGVGLLVQVGVRLLSHQVVTLALAETRTVVQYFGQLTEPPEQTRLTIGLLAVPAYLLVATLLGAGGLGLFALRARRRLQHRLHTGRSVQRFWRGALLALFRVQWIPILTLWALVPYLRGLHGARADGAEAALARLGTTAGLLALALPAAFVLFGGVGAVRRLLPRARLRAPRYALRPSGRRDHAFLQLAHHEGLRPWVEATWGWDDAQQAERVRDWLARYTPDIVTVRGVDAGYLLLREDEGALALLAVVLLPRFQGRGLGTRIVRDVIARAEARGRAVTLGVLRANPARRLYERLGFEVVEETETRLRMRREPG